MLPDPFFWYGLAFKAVMTAAVVVAASVAAERSGPFIAALIAALPTPAGATYIILALEHPPAFIAAGAVGSMAANAAVAIFALSYAALAQRHGIVLSIAAASLVWFAAVAGLRLVDWTPATALLLNGLVFAFTIPLSARYRAGAVARESFRRSSYDLPLRAAAVAVAVTVVTTASHWIGPSCIRAPAARRRLRSSPMRSRRSRVFASDFSACITSSSRSACGGPSRRASPSP